MMRSLRLLSLLSLLLATACSGGVGAEGNDAPKVGPFLGTGTNPADTSGVATKDIFPSMSVQADENGIHVYAALIYPAGNFLALGNGDTLTATVNGTTQTLAVEMNDSAGDIDYVTTFPVQDTPQAVISFMRTGGEPSAPNSVVPLAAPFQLSGPATVVAATGGSFNLPITFTTVPALPAQMPATEALTFRISGACVAAANSGADEPAFADGQGDVFLNLNDFIDPSAQGCAVSGDLRVATQGTWDPAFDTDSSHDIFQGLQHRGFDVTANPE